MPLIVAFLEQKQMCLTNCMLPSSGCTEPHLVFGHYMCSHGVIPVLPYDPL